MSMKKKFVASGLAAGLVAGAGAGLILQSSGFAGASNSTSAVSAAVTDDTSDTGTGTSDTGTSTDPGADRSARLTEVLQPLVDAGTLTADQMQAVIDALAAAGPMGGGHGGPGGDHGGRGGRGPGLDAAATALGITTDELRTQLEAGSTLADVAAAEGVDVQTVIDALVADVKAHLDEEVTEGDLTQAEADTKLADATTRITDGVTNGFPQRGDGDRPAPGDAPADAPATSGTGA
jgi:polyhydroxyalkanoate synthesis regulator phasin